MEKINSPRIKGSKNDKAMETSVREELLKVLWSFRLKEEWKKNDDSMVEGSTERLDSFSSFPLRSEYEEISSH